jgi:hypothetical protein
VASEFDENRRLKEHGERQTKSSSEKKYQEGRIERAEQENHRSSSKGHTNRAWETRRQSCQEPTRAMKR